MLFVFFFFNDTATTEIYTLSLHDALPISPGDHSNCRSCDAWPAGERFISQQKRPGRPPSLVVRLCHEREGRDRKSTRLNSSHLVISYAVFCLKKKKQNKVYELVSSLDLAD